MFPVLFELPGGFAIHTYGVMLALAVMQAAVLMRRWGNEEGLPGDQLYDMVFWTLLGGLIGARLEYMRVNWSIYEGNLFAFFNLRQGGLVFYGGLIGAFITFVVSSKRRGLPIPQVLDIIAPVVPLGHVLGRLGCFAAGCCYGKVTEVAWAVKFTATHCAALGAPNPDGLPICIPEPLNTPLHPTQLYEAGYTLLLGLFLVWLRRKRRFRGQVMLAYLSIYPLLRSVNEIFRGDVERGYFLESRLGPVLTNAQFTSILIVLASISTSVYLWRRSKGSSGQKASSA